MHAPSWLALALLLAGGCSFELSGIDSASGTDGAAPDLAQGDDLAGLDLASTDTAGAVDQSTPPDLTVQPGALGLSSFKAGKGNDLTTGTIDWAQYALAAPSDINRKLTGNNQIIASAVGGTPARYGAYPISFDWSDGTPTPMFSGAQTGLFINTGVGSGFQVQVPADLNDRKLHLFVGVYQGQGTMSAQLSDGSAAPVAGSASGGAMVLCYEFVIAFRGGSQTMLTASWTLTQDNQGGAVSLLAATIE
jgi:hypothetical protein